MKPDGKEAFGMAIHSLLGYIDPGSGTLLLQALVAAGLGSLVCLRGFLGRLAGTLVGHGSRAGHAPSEKDASGPCSSRGT